MNINMQNNLNTKIAEGNVSLRNIIEEDLIQIIRGLSSEELLGAYRSLSGLKTISNSNLKIREKNNQLEKDIIREYSTHLRSQNKASSTIKDYLNISVKFTYRANIIAKSINIYKRHYFWYYDYRE